MSAQRGMKSGYLPSLDGWRTVAILSVMMYHDSVHRIGSFSNSFLHEYGNLGVDLFFAISGLLICSRLLEEDRLKGSISLRGFYLRRLFRITPASWVFLTGYTLLGLAHQLPLDWGGIASSMLMIRNFWIRFAGDGGNTWYTVHFWSLSVEEHFYLLLPGLLVFGRRWRTQFVGCLALLFLLWFQIVQHYTPIPPTGLPLRTDMRLHELLIPAFFALLLAKANWKEVAVRWIRPWVVIAAFTVSELLLSRAPKFHSKTLLVSILIPVGFSLAVVATMYHPRAWLTQLLETAPMRFIGRISYSLYLWQQLFFPNVQTPAQPPFLMLQRFPYNYLAAFACAMASFYLIEKPLIRMGHKFAHPATPGHQDLDVVPAVVEPVTAGSLQLE